MKNPANRISFLVQSSVALPSIPLTSLLFIIVVVFIASTTSTIPPDAWMSPCSGGENGTQLEFLDENGKFKEEAKKSFKVKNSYETLSENAKLLGKKLKSLFHDYYTARFNESDAEIYKLLNVDFLSPFGWEHLESLSENDNKLVNEAYENFAIFSMFLHYANSGEEKETLEKKFSDRYSAMHSNSENGVASILCELWILTKFFGPDEKLPEKIEALKVERMVDYQVITAFVRHLTDYLTLRQFKENLESIRKYFLLRSVTYNDDGQDPSDKETDTKATFIRKFI